MDLLNALPHDLLNTNRAPSQLEMASARTILSHIEDEISKLCVQIAQLESKKRSLQEQERNLKCVFAPLRRVPQDVIRLIFTYCIDTRPTLSSKRAPILLTHICSGLRKIAFEMPTLWSALDIHVEIPCEGDTDGSLRFLAVEKSRIEECLRRSGSLPLKLFISYYHRQYPAQENPAIAQLYYDIFCVVLACRARWRKMSISFAGLNGQETLIEKMLSELALLDPDSVPLLCSLHLERREDDYEGDPHYRIGFLPILGCRTLKKLSGVHLDGLDARKDHLTLSMPNLTHLNCSIGHSQISTSNILVTLGLCVSLIRLRIHVYNLLEHESPGQQNRTELPSLQILDITTTYSDREAVPRLMKYISAPNLKHLSLRNGISFINTGIVDFLKHSPTLTELYFDAQISSDLFIEMLRYCPELKYLARLPVLFSDNRLLDKVIYDRLFKRLVDADDTGNIVCPKLEAMVSWHQIQIRDSNILHSLITRKATPSQELAAWKLLQADVVVHVKKDTDVNQLRQQCNNSQIRLRTIFFPSARP